MTIGEALRRFRTEFKLKQEDVAGVLNLTRQAYNFYETGKSTPPSQKIVDLADKYGVTTDYLLGRSDKPRPAEFDEEEIKEAFALRDMIGKTIVRQLSGQVTS